MSAVMTIADIQMTGVMISTTSQPTSLMLHL
jgi:hypothetical protein